MALIFVSDATGNDGDDGLTEANAKLTLAGALAIAATEDVIAVKADGTYTFGSAAVVADDNLRIVGYFTNPPTESEWWTSDCSPGGAQYKLQWAVFDGNAGAYSQIQCDGKSALRMYNIKFQNTPTTQTIFDFVTNFVTSVHDYMFDNCWFIDGGGPMDCTLIKPTFIDCKVTGDWITTGAFGPFKEVNGAVFLGCYFNMNSGSKCFNLREYNATDPDDEQYTIPSLVMNCVFTMGATSTIRNGFISNTAGGGIFINNIFYEPAGSTFTGGAMGVLEGLGYGLSIGGHTTDHYLIMNNIFLSEKSSSQMFSIIILPDPNVEKPNYISNNCYFNVQALDLAARQGDIEVDPQFVNAAGYDFRLNPNSPCLNTGRQFMTNNAEIAGRSSMGAWLPHALAIQERRSRYQGTPIHR